MNYCSDERVFLKVRNFFMLFKFKPVFLKTFGTLSVILACVEIFLFWIASSMRYWTFSNVSPADLLILVSKKWKFSLWCVCIKSWIKSRIMILQSWRILWESRGNYLSHDSSNLLIQIRKNPILLTFTIFWLILKNPCFLQRTITTVNKFLKSSSTKIQLHIFST